MNMILLGPPGAGKGTQAKRLEARLGIPAIASGDIFRAIREEQSPLADEVRQYMDRGEYVADHLTIQIVLARLRQPDAAHGFILDGFPRTLTQAEALQKAQEGAGETIDLALVIRVPHELVLQRLTSRVVCYGCGCVYNLISKPPLEEMICDGCSHALSRRTDETPEVVAERLEVFAQQTEPLIEYYRQRGVAVEVDGAGPIGEVDARVDQVMHAASLRRARAS